MASEKQLSRGGKGCKDTDMQNSISIIIQKCISMEWVVFYFPDTHWTERKAIHLLPTVQKTLQSFFHLSLPDRFFVFYLGVGCFVVAVLTAFGYSVWWHGVLGVCWGFLVVSFFDFFFSLVGFG